jgi:hypothetical protein
MGLNAGATGLALKTVLVNVISVNTGLYFAAKILNLRFWRYLGHQVVSVLILMVMAYIVAVTTDHIFSSFSNIFFRFLVSGIIFTLITIGLGIIFPELFGLARKDIKLFQSKFKSLYIDVTGRK